MVHRAWARESEDTDPEDSDIGEECKASSWVRDSLEYLYEAVARNRVMEESQGVESSYQDEAEVGKEPAACLGR